MNQSRVALRFFVNLLSKTIPQAGNLQLARDCRHLRTMQRNTISSPQGNLGQALGNRSVLAAILLFTLFSLRSATAESVPVRHTEGIIHGFLLLRSLDGKTLAEGDLTELAKGELVTTHL